ncbi:hypothetical protein NQ314_001436 [Rhamnusium bicolor]|uniref:Uncharacterized protein n=1 Tax=Rhamnusium bicolor TaxID=1586634 RepID=A0AAV8ZTX5_9CUCU|nr:hypothetical protein NQ314_001436 [Rhamnusium bicolor]
MSFNSDSDLEVKVRKSTERISENMHIVANEPSLAFYRLQEHVRKALNPMVDRRVDNIHDNLKNAIFLKQQLKYEESRRKKSDTNSVYKRLSAHITLDLPELPELSDVVRETANRVEHMMSKATHSSSNS